MGYFVVFEANLKNIYALFKFKDYQLSIFIMDHSDISELMNISANDRCFPVFMIRLTNLDSAYEHFVGYLY